LGSEFLVGRGHPWDHDAGPPRNRRWAELFAATPNYRALGKAVVGKEQFRWHFGPMFYRGRLEDGAVRVLVIGQEGAQDESLGHRSFVGGTGARMQHFLNHLGITGSYLFLNTFVYPINGQYGGSELRWLAQHPDSPIAQHRQAILDYVLERNDLRLVVAVGNAAKETVVSWVEAHGGAAPAGASDVSRCDGSVLRPRTRIVGVRHPGGATKGGSVSAIIADFKKAIRQVETWSAADRSWLPPDVGAHRLPASDYKYKSAPIPLRDLPYGVSWRVGQGGTSSNRKDAQRSIQMFSEAGEYGASASYASEARGSREGYVDESGDLPYEPPKRSFAEYDPGPGAPFARLFMGGQAGLEWPDLEALGVRLHPSFGHGPIYRGRPTEARILVLGDEQCHDDFFTGRALTGDAGQRLQKFLAAAGITKSYLILRVLPVDTTDVPPATVNAILDHSKVRALYSAIVQRVVDESSTAVVLSVGPHANRLADHVLPGSLRRVRMKAWSESGALADWRRALDEIEAIPFARDASSPSFLYDGTRGQIPRGDLPFGTLRWQGSSGDRAVRARKGARPSPDYLKLCMPQWAFELAATPLSPEEQAAVDKAPR
jgi:uracil-DNA glycosylase